MKRFTVAACVLSVFAAGCDETLNPVAPTPGQVTLASQLSGAANVPPGFEPGGRKRRHVVGDDDARRRRRLHGELLVPDRRAG